MTADRDTATHPGGPRCLIVGCGYVGTRLAQRLATDHEVLAVVRSAASADALRARHIDVRQMDFDARDVDRALLPELAMGSAVFYLAPPAEQDASDPRLARFLRALGHAIPAVFIYMSTTGVYGDTAGGIVTEGAELAPSNDRSRRRVAAERSTIEWCAARRVRHVILRVPGIYGPDRLPLERLHRGEPVLRPEDAGPGNRIHVDDLVSACVAALACRASGAFNVTDGDHASTSEYFIATARLAGLPEPQLVARAEAQSRISPGMLSYLGETRRVDNTRMREVLRVHLQYPDMRAGIAASLAEMRSIVRS